MKTAIVVATMMFFCGCTRVEYLEYRGVQAWPKGSAFVQTIEGVDLYEGLPPQDYDVIGLIDVYDDKPFYHDASTRKKVIQLAKDHKADAILWLSDRTVSSGFLKMGAQSSGPASVDTGRSSQPEMIVTSVTQNVATSYKKSLRSSLLIVTWKSSGGPES